jgi:SET domain-containing protein
MSPSSGSRPPMYRVRRSKIHGRGVFAARRIRKGTRIIEYIGERVSHAEADRRYEDRPEDDNHTFLFIVDARTVIDAGVGGNAARYINHACAPNCETVIEKGRVFIQALRTIQPSEELSYDYQIKREPGDPPDIDEIFATNGCCPGAGREQHPRSRRWSALAAVRRSETLQGADARQAGADGPANLRLTGPPVAAAAEHRHDA